MNELEKILKIGSDYKIDKQEERIENKKIIKVIYVSCKKKNAQIVVSIQVVFMIN